MSPKHSHCLDLILPSAARKQIQTPELSPLRMRASLGVEDHDSSYGWSRAEEMRGEFASRVLVLVGEKLVIVFRGLFHVLEVSCGSVWGQFLPRNDHHNVTRSFCISRLFPLCHLVQPI